MYNPELDSPIRRFARLADYEAWATENWVYPFGTTDAQHHFNAKLREEAEEVLAELNGDQTGLLSEAGDLMWTTAAVVANCGIGVHESLCHALPCHFSAGKPALTEEIDALVDVNMEDLEPGELQKIVAEIRDELGLMSDHQLEMFRLTDPHQKPAFFVDAYIALMRGDIMDCVARATVLCAVLARLAGADLQTVMEYNATKLEARLAAGMPVTKLSSI